MIETHVRPTDDSDSRSRVIQLVSLREAGQRLGKDPKYVKGFAEALRIRLEPGSRSLFMTQADLERLNREIATRRQDAARTGV